MTEVLFYQLERQPLVAVLAKLLQATLNRGARAVVQAGSAERVAALDTQLWTFSDESFLPHGTGSDGGSEHQPIFLTDTDENPNGARYRFFVDGADFGDLGSYERAIFIFDGRPADELESARNRWRQIKSAGHEATYWRQSEAGRWEKQA